MRSLLLEEPSLDKVNEETSEIIYEESEYYEQERDIFVVPFEIESYDVPILYFILVDKETGVVICTQSKHGYVEDWE